MRSWNFAVIAILFSISTATANSELIESNPPGLVIKAPLAPGKDALITVSEQVESSPEQIQKILQDSRAQHSDLIVSTDQESVLEAVLQATGSPGDTREVRLVPIGKIASLSQKIASGFNGYYQRAKHTVLRDRIGLTVLTVTVGYDTLIWIHSASFDIHQKTSMVMMNLFMAATFGLDRDLWTKMTGPLKNKLISTFDRFVVSDKLTAIKTLSSQFLSNVIFGVGVQVVRTGLLSLDHLAQAVTNTDFWLTAAKIGGLFTLTAFAWTEMYGNIQIEKNPVAKLMMKRISEMRWLILSQLASISMVLQPEVYGHTPIVSFVIHGTLGLLVLTNAERIMEFLETNAFVNRIYKKIQTFESFINTGLRFNPGAPILTCEGLFAR